MLIVMEKEREYLSKIEDGISIFHDNLTKGVKRLDFRSKKSLAFDTHQKSRYLSKERSLLADFLGILTKF